MALEFAIKLEFRNVDFCGGRKTGEPGLSEMLLQPPMTAIPSHSALSTLLLRVIPGLPGLLLPFGAQVSAVLAMSGFSFLDQTL